MEPTSRMGYGTLYQSGIGQIAKIVVSEYREGEGGGYGKRCACG